MFHRFLFNGRHLYPGCQRIVINHIHLIGGYDALNALIQLFCAVHAFGRITLLFVICQWSFSISDCSTD